MKSKRAEQVIERPTNYPLNYETVLEKLLKRMVVKAVELAEEDARERAVKAFCGHCKITHNPARCYGVTYCPIADNYIKKYDNEN